MLQDSPLNRIFIRVSIFALRAIAPACSIYTGARVCGFFPRPSSRQAQLIITALDTYAIAETVFYFLVHLPRKWWLNRAAAPHNPLPTRHQRRQTLEKTWGATPDPRLYLSGWFKWTDVGKIHSEDVKDWLYWRLWNSRDRHPSAEDELESYAAITEKAIGVTFPTGHGPHKSMAVTFEPVRMQHRPLFYYCLLVGGADLQFSFLMMLYGYQFHSLSLSRFLSSLPLRPFSFLTQYRSLSSNISYWHSEHTAKDHLPVLFLHGIGVGLHYYLDFFREFLNSSKPRGVQGHIGLIAIELLPVSARLTHPALSQEVMASQILTILDHHGWGKCVLMTHSYGSIVATHMLHNEATAARIGPMLMVDPVAFSFHDPHVPWNFLRRRPTTASEIQLQYFASLDPGVAHALTRRFVWVENSLWHEEVAMRDNGPCTVALAGRDIITETESLGRYLTGEKKEDQWKRKQWTGEERLEVMWFPECNHAEEFDTAADRARLLRVLLAYSALAKSQEKQPARAEPRELKNESPQDRPA